MLKSRLHYDTDGSQGCEQRATACNSEQRRAAAELVVSLMLQRMNVLATVVGRWDLSAAA